MDDHQHSTLKRPRLGSGSAVSYAVDCGKVHHMNHHVLLMALDKEVPPARLAHSVSIACTVTRYPFQSAPGVGSSGLAMFKWRNAHPIKAKPRDAPAGDEDLVIV